MTQKYVVRHIARPEASVVEEFSKLDVSTVYEAQGKVGLLGPDLKPIIDDVMICGPAVTAVCYAGDNLMIHAAIEVCQPGDILVVTTLGDSVAGMIGELIVSALIRRGVKGLIIDAGIRDVTRIRELGFPVWSKAVYSQGTTKSRGGWVNSPAVCSGQTVNPGDLIMADSDGVVVVRREDLSFALDASKKRVAKEEVTKSKIAAGELSLDFYGLRPVLDQEGVVYFDTYDDVK
ncbi:4-carboxy-4-hydroxy-2-oxoadipate aldolase/oxaloacetate decarboxylase [Alicyclobacillus dauci]|uniref:Putative 4-hydroxy-4-methyl-2-oxoglutarate aldolase n=1 Tax=Alicyclobacillus dauci TaxID=1475485 RepID=A0ABY6Z0E5_9BACL|nr:4-carboxy-4-hydroxy-2-oxoadipate aldolase/oxaloacetate decarboxylase [Alicyclobacillus dauci]WAH36330.1 4-carboxy-4-hydroxy-2-oxoadipate aldolase/oxaloacetate decarboxylase [Alicyclobacillus dauci]